MQVQLNPSFVLKNAALAALLGLVLPPAWAGLTCTPGSTPIIDFGDVYVLTPGSKEASQTISYTCDRGLDTGRRTRACFHIGEGTGSAAGLGGIDSYHPRVMSFTGGGGTYGAGFQIYQDAGRSVFWGSTVGATNQPDHFSTPANVTRPILFSPFTESITLYLRMEDMSTAINGNTTLQTLVPGTYTSSFAGNQTVLRAAQRLTTQSFPDEDCAPQGFGNDTTFPFSVTAKIQAQCKITTPPNDIDFGSQIGTATNLQGSTAVSVQCTRTTPYFIGLRPGNGNTAGAGVMSAISPVGNTDTVPYQLRQAAGMSGAIWGDTATTSSAGNGVAGTGLGSSASNYTIYATVPSANSAAGNYQDTVTMTVHY